MRCRMHVVLPLMLGGAPATVFGQQPEVSERTCTEAVAQAASAGGLATVPVQVRGRLPRCAAAGADQIARLWPTADGSHASLEQLVAWNHEVKSASIFRALQDIASDGSRPMAVRRRASSAMLSYIDPSWEVTWPSADFSGPAILGSWANGGGMQNAAVPDAAEQVFATLGNLEDRSRGTPFGDDVHSLRQTLLIRQPQVGMALAATALRLTPKCDRAYRLENRSTYSLVVRLEGTVPSRTGDVAIKEGADGFFHVDGDGPVRLLYQGREVARSQPALNRCW